MFLNSERQATQILAHPKKTKLERREGDGGGGGASNGLVLPRNLSVGLSNRDVNNCVGIFKIN
jgi:hypothetical protein